MGSIPVAGANIRETTSMVASLMFVLVTKLSPAKRLRFAKNARYEKFGFLKIRARVWIQIPVAGANMRKITFKAISLISQNPLMSCKSFSKCRMDIKLSQSIID